MASEAPNRIWAEIPQACSEVSCTYPGHWTLHSRQFNDTDEEYVRRKAVDICPHCTGKGFTGWADKCETCDGAGFVVEG